ncbi:MAG: DUF3467 domain-containing protein [Thermodesulfovibrionia bacterium]|nr:DUF3467 domain-containing protein [Thermodesulfovibrionia bacterium]
MANKPNEIKINIPPHIQAGVYANSMTVTHTKDEFIMDFSLITPPVGTVNARVITSPGHAKRIIAALQENVRRYESQFGTIVEADILQGKGPIGFNA